jgi:hypothetical protein
VYETYNLPGSASSPVNTKSPQGYKIQLDLNLPNKMTLNSPESPLPDLPKTHISFSQEVIEPGDQTYERGGFDESPIIKQN